jgi:branched-chain amino acid transport system permease protein
MNRVIKWILGGVGVLAVAAIPQILPSGAQTAFVFMVLAAISATGLSLLLGYAGQVSLGQGAFFGVGAVTAGLLSTLGWPPLVALLLAPVLAVAIAYLVGSPLLRLRGHYLAFGTLAVQVVLIAVVNGFDVFGGVYGLQGIPFLGVGSVQIKGGIGYSYLALIALAIVLVITRNIVRSRFGRGLRALASSESAAASAGVPVYSYKLTVFAIAAAFAGLAGGIMAFVVGFVGSASFSIAFSIQLLVMAVIGGLGTLWGGVLGAVLITILLQLLTTVSTMPGLPPTAPAILSYAVYAVLLVLALLFIPRGIIPAVSARIARSRAARQEQG